MNEFGAELIFKGRDLLTDSGLTNPTFFRDSGETPFFDNSDEYLHRIEFVHIASLFLWGSCSSGVSPFSPNVFRFGIACIPQTAVPACEDGPSDMRTGGQVRARSQSVESVE